MSYSTKREVFIIRYRPPARNTASSPETRSMSRARRTTTSSVVPAVRASTMDPMNRGGTTAAIDPAATQSDPRRSWVRCLPR